MSSILKEAVRLADLGFSVLWLHKRSKRPIESEWTELEVATPKRLKASYREGNNLGVRLGRPSRIGKYFLHVIDMDIRDPEFTDEARAKVANLLKVDLDDFSTVISGSGGDSRHFYLLTTEPFRSRKLWHSKEKFTDEDGKKHWCAEIEFFGTGKQVALPPSIHPSGEPYRWEVPLDVDTLPVIDAELLDDLVGHEDSLSYEEVDEVEPLGLSRGEALDMITELQDWADDRETWARVGMALRHEFGEDGWEIFDAWSKKGKGYDRRENRAQWKSFKDKRHSVVTMRSVVAEVREREVYEIIDRADEDDAEDDIDFAEMFEDVADEKRPRMSTPPHLLKIPGVLQEVVDYYNANSVMDQPQLAVTTAIALGSVVLGRHWSTTFNNFSSLYIVNVAKTGAGKEYGFRLIERLIKAAGYDDYLVGKPRYTSDAGIMSELFAKPRHISMPDEVGIYWGAGNKQGNSLQDEARATFMELWGRLDGTQYEKGYSTKGLSKEQADAMSRRKVVFPAITLYGATTPVSFYEALSMKMVVNGFLNRMLIIHSDIGRQRSRLVRQEKLPPRVVRWIKDHVWPKDPDEDSDFDVTSILNPLAEPTVMELPFTAKAEAYLVTLEDMQIEQMDRLESYGFDDFFSRSREMAMRLALIVALSCRSNSIKYEHLKWAGDFVFHHMKRAVGHLIKNMDRDDVDDVVDKIVKAVKDAGEEGFVARKVWHNIRGYKELKFRRDEVHERLKNMHGITLAEVRNGKRGPKKQVFIEAKHLRKSD